MDPHNLEDTSPATACATALRHGAIRAIQTKAWNGALDLARFPYGGI